MDISSEFENKETHRLEDLLSQVHQDRLLVISKERAELYDLLELGEHGMQSVRAGETEYVFRAENKMPVLSNSYRISLQNDLEFASNRNYEKELITDSFVDTARAMLKQPTNPSEKILCKNCRGKAYFTYSCSCADGGVVFTDEESGEVSRLREVGVPDNDCTTCEGTGQQTSACGTCKGTTSSYKYPMLTLTNEQTGQSTTELLDAAQLIVDGKLPVYSSHEGVMLTVKVPDLMKQMAREIGINPDQLVGIAEHGNYELDDDRADLYIHPLGDTSRRANQETKPPMTQMQVIEAMQDQLSYTFSHQWQSILDEAGVAKGRNLRVSETPNVTGLLKELIEILEYNNYRLGYRPGFIETGISGPSFIALNSDMQSVGKLSAESSLSLAIVNAHRRIKEYVAEA